MAIETLDLSTHFKTELYTWDYGYEPEMTLDFDGFGVESSIDLTVEQAKELILQLQKFVDLSESAHESA